MRGVLIMKIKIKSRDQSGAALVIALIMIVVLSLIGLAATFNSTYEIKLSGNKRVSTDAFYLTETRQNQTVNGIRTIVPRIAPSTLPEDDSGLTADERNSGLDQEGLNRRIPVDPGSFNDPVNFPEYSLPSGAILQDTPNVTIYHSKWSPGEGQGSTKPDSYIIDTFGTDQITGSGLFRSRCHLRTKIVVRGVTTEESQ
jgi:hypothetical protein